VERINGNKEIKSTRKQQSKKKKEEEERGRGVRGKRKRKLCSES
jgi:hypothetical protein